MRESPAPAPPPPPPFKNDLDLIIHIDKKNQYQNIQRLEIHLYTILRASSLQKKNNATPILPTTYSPTNLLICSSHIYHFFVFFSFSEFVAVQNK